MIWPFDRKEKKAAAFMADLDTAVALCAEKWLFFNETLKFNETVFLRDQISMFAVPMSEGLKNSFKSMRGAPDALLFMTIAMGVHASGTHTKAQIEEALGAPLVGIE